MKSAPPETDTVVDASGWNDREVSALGERVRLFVNGLETVNIENQEERTEGIAGFQVQRGEDVRVGGKDTRILNLSNTEDS